MEATATEQTVEETQEELEATAETEELEAMDSAKDADEAIELEDAESEEMPEETEENSEALAIRPPDKLAEKISGLRKAAILCLSLGEEAASVLFRHLDEEEVQLLSRELALLPEVKSEVSNEVALEFDQLLLTRSYITMGGVDYAKRLLIRSFGTDSAKRLTDKVLHSLESTANLTHCKKPIRSSLPNFFNPNIRRRSRSFWLTWILRPPLTFCINCPKRSRAKS